MHSTAAVPAGRAGHGRHRTATADHDARAASASGRPMSAPGATAWIVHTGFCKDFLLIGYLAHLQPRFGPYWALAATSICFGGSPGVMKSVGGFLRNVVQRKEGGLVGRTFRVGAYTIRVEAHLGDGGFASIYRVRDTSSSSAFALKHMRMGGEREALADCHTEVETMQRLRDHPNILTLRAVAYVGPKGAEQEAFLLLDLCRESLVDYMRAAGGPLPDSDVLTIFHSVCKAVAIMHHQNPPLSHRDLKAENVLLHNNGTWVLCDFGSATSWAGCYEGSNEIMVAEENIRKYTTAAYRAPEMFDLYSRECIDIKADMWALGVLLSYICFQQLPFVGDCKLQVLNGDYTLPSTRPQPFLDLIKGLLCVSPAKRLGIDAVLQQLERLTSYLPAKILPSGPPSVNNAANSRENGNSTSDKIAARGPTGSRQGRARSGGPAAPSGAGGGGWDAGGWDVGSWDQLPSSTGAPAPVAPTQESYPTVSPRREPASITSSAAPAREEPLLVPSTSIPKPPDEPKPLTPARAGASGNLAPKLQMSSPSVPGLRQSSSLKALGASRGGLDLMDAPAQLTSRSLDRGTSATSPSAGSDADAERRDSGGSRGSAGDAASRAALLQQLSELSNINRQLTAAIEEKDVIIAQLQVDIEQAKLSKRPSAAGMQRVNDSNKGHGGLVDDGWVASFGERGSSREGRGPARSTAAELVQPSSGAASPQPPLRRSVSPWGKEGSAEPGTLSPDHPLKSLEQSLSQLDPFNHASEPLTAAPIECPASTGSLKPSRLGMKLRGSSFEAFEDLEDVMPSDAGHISPPPGGTPTASVAEQSKESVGKKVKGPRHRRTTSEPTPIESWQPQSEWA